MSVTRVLRVWLISVVCVSSSAAQALPAQLPSVTSQHALVLQQQLPPPRMPREKDGTNPVQSILTWTVVGAVFGVGLSYYATCTYSEDRSCPARTIGVSALMGAFVGLLAM